MFFLKKKNSPPKKFFFYLFPIRLFSADAAMFSKKKIFNFLPMKNLLRIGQDPFFPQSSPGISPQPKIDFPYYEISGPDICELFYS